MARVRLFGPARDAAGVASAQLPGTNVAQVVAASERLFGADFSRVLARSRLWLNGEETDLDAPVNDDDELAVIPPVSGGAR